MNGCITTRNIALSSMYGMEGTYGSITIMNETFQCCDNHALYRKS